MHSENENQPWETDKDKYIKRHTEKNPIVLMAILRFSFS